MHSRTIQESFQAVVYRRASLLLDRCRARIMAYLADAEKTCHGPYCFRTTHTPKRNAYVRRIKSFGAAVKGCSSVLVGEMGAEVHALNLSPHIMTATPKGVG